MTGMNCNFECKVIGTPRFGVNKNGKEYVSFNGVYEEYNKETNICLIKAYGPSAVAGARSLTAGQMVHIEGAIFANKWDDAGVQKFGLSVNANRIDPVAQQQADYPSY